MDVDAGFWTHAIMWFVGALSLGTFALVVGAWFTLGRSAYRKH